MTTKTHFLVDTHYKIRYRVRIGELRGKLMIQTKWIYGFVVISTLALGCQKNRYYITDPQSVEPPLPRLTNYSKSSQRVTVMTWNMENLYDTENDPKKDDDTFLPLEVKNKLPKHKEKCNKKGTYSWIQQCLNWDWNEDMLQLKFQRLAEVLHTVNDGKGPDILVVQEIENFAVLDRLNQEHLKDLGYTTYLLENNDYRGIDVGLLTRLPVTQTPILQSLRARPGLITQVKLPGGQKMNFIGVHFPISPTPIEERLDMLKTLRQFIADRPDELTIAAGDFNFPQAYNEHYSIVKNHVRPYWVPSHLYCKGECPGTSFDSYEREWSFLDMILLSPSFFDTKSSWTLDTDSVHVFNKLPSQIAPDESPADFNLPNPKGVSDHWPLVIQLVKTKKQ